MLRSPVSRKLPRTLVLAGIAGYVDCADLTDLTEWGCDEFAAWIRRDCLPPETFR